MATQSVLEELARIRQWPIEWQVELAEGLNSLTWREQWDALCDRICGRAQGAPVSDEEIDAVVRQVRREKPLQER
jgi:hypothetical protein